jgi:23S rRNA (adenine2503-C2)-methyltransferase
MRSFFEYTLPELEAGIENMGLKKYRAKQIYKWVYVQNVLDPDLMTNLSKDLRVTLKGLFSFALPEVNEILVSRDESVKFGFSSQDGHLFESVLMPENDRYTLCLSTQIGCKMSCRFCVTGKIGFIRDLTVAEIIGQVVAAKRHLNGKRITNLVFMGMGEPMDNMDNLLKVLDIVKDPAGLDFSYRRITISTVGMIEGLRAMEPKTANLAISLNAAVDSKRTYLMPINRMYPLRDVLAVVRSIKKMPRTRVTFEYVMLRNVNDSIEDAKLLAQLLTGMKCKINLIPYNESPYTEFRTPDMATVEKFRAYLIDRKFTAIIRESRGADIGGGCGQLGMKYLEGSRG